MFEIEMLPAREGDCLWIRYGNSASPRQILIDGGRAATFKDVKARLGSLPANRRTFELLIITHVDRDHIEGVLSLLNDKTLKLKFKDIWFNGYAHLKQAELESFGAVQGERLSARLLDDKLPWNKAWGKKAVCLKGRTLVTKTLDGNMKLTLLSPDRIKLSKLIPSWENECRKAGLVAGIGSKPASVRGLESFGAINIEKLAQSPFQDDSAEANGSSIAVLAEFNGKKALLTGDAHADRLIESIKILKKSSKTLKVDVVKLAHHGSEHNVSNELLQLLDCSRYLISTNGNYFHHPAPAAIARLILTKGKGATLYFNYQNKYTSVWNNGDWTHIYKYLTVYPEKKANGCLAIRL